MILSPSQRKGSARERLLARLLDAFGEALPPPEMSLREIAARIETSHALLRYHFGSLWGVLAAMLKAQRSRDNEALLEAAQQGTFDDFVGAIWRTYTRPEQLSRVRGFFYVVGLAAYGPEAQVRRCSAVQEFLQEEAANRSNGDGGRRSMASYPRTVRTTAERRPAAPPQEPLVRRQEGELKRG